MKPAIHLWSCDQNTPSQGILALRIVLGPPILSLGPQSQERKDVERAMLKIDMKLDSQLLDEISRHDNERRKVRDVIGGTLPLPFR